MNIFILACHLQHTPEFNHRTQLCGVNSWNLWHWTCGWRWLHVQCISRGILQQHNNNRHCTATYVQQHACTCVFPAVNKLMYSYIKFCYIICVCAGACHSTHVHVCVVVVVWAFHIESQHMISWFHYDSVYDAASYPVYIHNHISCYPKPSYVRGLCMHLQKACQAHMPSSILSS